MLPLADAGRCRRRSEATEAVTFENNLLSILSFASTRSTWVSVSSCAHVCGVEYDSVRQYMMLDEFAGVAERYRYDYRIRVRRNYTRASTLSYYLSAVSRGYA